MEGDEELIERANRGDAEAFEQLYRRYRDWVYRLACRFTGNQQDAQVKHLSLNVRRRRAAGSLDATALDDVPAPEPPASSRAELAAAMASLASEQREVVLMRFVDGMSLEEIAVALHIPLGTTKSRLHNALRKLRDDPRTRDYFLG